MWAVVPLKRYDQAKQRLANLLSTDERRQLVAAMANDVLTALGKAHGLSGTLLVSREPAAADLADHHGALLFAEPEGSDLSESVQAAGGFLMAN